MDLTRIRVQENIGIVGSEASTSGFNFFLTPLKDIENRRGDYVLIDHPIFGSDCPVLAFLKNIKNYEEVVGATLGEKSVKTTADAEVIGFIDLSRLKMDIVPIHRMAVPVRPGNRVYLPYHNFLQDIFSRTLEGKPFTQPLHLGEHNLKATDEEGVSRRIHLNLEGTELYRQHTVITAMTGIGKTHTATVIAEELANKYRQPVVIFDPHGEYLTMGVARKHVEELVTNFEGSVSAYPFNFPVSIYAYDEEETVRALQMMGINLEEEPRYSIKPLTLTDKGLKEPLVDRVTTNIRGGKTIIFNMKGLAPEKRAVLFTEAMGALYEERMRKRVPPFFVILEETETMTCVPSAESLLQRIASEGVKMGIAMCFLCQHPAELEEGILSQTGMQLMGRTVDPNDLELMEYMAQEELNALPNLRVGEWLLNGMRVLTPTLIRVRDRYSVGDP